MQKGIAGRLGKLRRGIGAKPAPQQIRDNLHHALFRAHIRMEKDHHLSINVQRLQFPALIGAVPLAEIPMIANCYVQQRGQSASIKLLQLVNLLHCDTPRGISESARLRQ